MRKLIVLLAIMCGLVLFVVPSAGAQSTTSPQVEGWGGPAPGVQAAGFGPTPVDILFSGTPTSPEIQQISTTNRDTYVLTTSGTVWAAGDNTYGGLGDPQQQPSSYSFVQVQFPKLRSTDAPPDITSLASVGPFETEIALDNEGNVWGWGANNADQLCTTGQQDTPLELTNLPRNPESTKKGVYTLAAGAGNHASYYNSTYNTIYSCGEGKYGALGNGAKTSSATPVKVKDLDPNDPTATVTAMTASWEDEGVVMSDGTYWNWGYNGFGQLGDGPTNGTPMNADVPTEVTDFPDAPAGYSVVAQAAEGGGTKADGSTMMLLSDPSDPGAPYLYYGWGDDQEGQLCDGFMGSTNNYDTPHSISPSITVDANQQPISSVAAGGVTGYVLTTSGALYGCGDNTDGQLGQGSTQTTDYTTPTPILPGDTVTQISSTNWNTAALITSSG
jgi:alpha-tubulin suppressor-like RCC1 family protein